MKTNNICETYRKRIEKIHRQIVTDMVQAANQLGQKLRDETVMRTPVDNGDLREKWALMPVEKIGNKYIIRITNPAEYAAFVEFGYMQRPGMILKMKEVGGKLRFEKFLGYAKSYKMGDPTGKVPPDENGFVTIVTRKRFIKGRFMAREGLEVTRDKHWPKLRKYLLARMKDTWRQT